MHNTLFFLPPSIRKRLDAWRFWSLCWAGLQPAGSHGYISPNLTQRGRLCLVERGVDRDVPALWLATWASPGRLLASLARPPLVRSWWMAVLLVTPEPVETTGTARTRVPPAGLSEVKTCPWVWAFPTIVWEKQGEIYTFIQQNARVQCKAKGQNTLKNIF